VACVLEGVLEGDVFLAEFVTEFRVRVVDRGDRWRGVGCDGCLLGRGAVVGVLEDSYISGQRECRWRKGKWGLVYLSDVW